MKYKFFPGSELSPPNLLGGIVDLDKPQHLVANVFVGDDRHIQIRPVSEMPDQQLRELETFANNLPTSEFKRTLVSDIMAYTSRRKAMC